MSTNEKRDDGKPKLSDEQKKKMKKYAVFALMGIIFSGCIWLIFAPPANKKAGQGQQAGFNTDIPMPKEETLISDKRDAYEQEQVKQKQEERMRSLSDFSALLGDHAPAKTGELAPVTDEPVNKSAGGNYGTHPQSPMQSSARAYNDINRTLGNFYETPKEDPEKEQLKRELDELKMRMDETVNRKNPVDEQLSLMEKSFQMAAKYMPGAVESTVSTDGDAGGNGQTTGSAGNNQSGKLTTVPVSHAHLRTVSALLPEMTGQEFIRAYSRPRNTGFLTVANEADAGVKNTISACIHTDQTITDGQNVRLRLLEAMQVGNTIIPRNAFLSGTAKIQGERLGITVNYLKYNEAILPVGLTVCDLDGQEGIFIPNLQEMNAVKEIVANMGNNAGTNISLSNDAGGQFAADMGRNAIQGVSQFTAKKLREVKVRLKAGYRILLLPEGGLNTNNPQFTNKK